MVFYCFCDSTAFSFLIAVFWEVLRAVLLPATDVFYGLSFFVRTPCVLDEGSAVLLLSALVSLISKAKKGGAVEGRESSFHACG